MLSYLPACFTLRDVRLARAVIRDDTNRLKDSGSIESFVPSTEDGGGRQTSLSRKDPAASLEYCGAMNLPASRLCGTGQYSGGLRRRRQVFEGGLGDLHRRPASACECSFVCSPAGVSGRGETLGRADVFV